MSAVAILQYSYTFKFLFSLCEPSHLMYSIYYVLLTHILWGMSECTPFSISLFLCDNKKCDQKHNLLRITLTSGHSIALQRRWCVHCSESNSFWSLTSKLSENWTDKDKEEEVEVQEIESATNEERMGQCVPFAQITHDYHLKLKYSGYLEDNLNDYWTWSLNMIQLICSRQSNE